MKLTPSLLEAVWAATYVRVLSAIPCSSTGLIHELAEVLGDPTQARVHHAQRAANRAVDALQEMSE